MRAAAPARAERTDADAAQRVTRRSASALVALFLGIALAAVLTLVNLPYVVRQPGFIVDTLESFRGTRLITVKGAQTYPAEGSLDFTTIRDLGRPGDRLNAWELLYGILDPRADVFPREDLYPPGITGKEVDELGTAQMINSQQEAIAVALKELGEPVTERVTIAAVAEDAPSAASLRRGDEIVAVDGTRVAGAETVREAVQKHRPGETVRLQLRRDGSLVEVAATTRDSDGRTTVGVFLGRDFDFPFEVQIHAGDVGGPSAGMMFALGIYDTLTPGSLTGGRRVAGTGTVDVSGEVGPIGGIRQKLVGASEGGAEVFLAPSANCDEVVGHVPDGLRVVRVATFDDALSAVRQVAAGRAEGLPTCTR